MQDNTDVRVKVFQDEDGVLKIDCSRPVPGLKRVARHLAKQYQKDAKRQVDYGRDVLGAITRTSGIIPFQDWANAIGEALIQADADSVGGNYTANAMREPAYLALGDTLFKLSPVELIATNKALAATKKRANEKAEIQVKEKLREGQLAADTLVETAQNLKREAEDTLRRASRQTPPPNWAVDGGVPCRHRSGLWAVECVIGFAIEYFDIHFYNDAGVHKSFRWEAVPQNNVPTRLWVPLNKDGTCAITTIYVDHMCNEIPHISHYCACMSLGDAPKAIKDLDDLYTLQYSIERCMRGVQLDSLRTSLEDWLPKFKDSVPPALYEALSDRRRWTEKTIALARSLDAASPVPEEGQTTWTA